MVFGLYYLQPFLTWTKTQTMKANSQLSLYCLLFCLLFITNNTQAQIGIKGGAGVSDIVFANVGQTPYLGYEIDYLTHRFPAFSYQFGGYGIINLHKHFDFQPELLIAKQGLNYNIDFLYDNVVYKLNIYYIQMPLIIKWRFRVDKKAQPNLFLGPYGSLKLAAKRIKIYDGIDGSEDMENVKPYDMGLAGGFGYDFEMKSGKFITEFRFNYSLVNIMDYAEGHIPDYNGPEEERAKNLCLYLMAGYSFGNLSKKKDK